MNHADYIQPNVQEWLAAFHFHTKINVRFGETDAFGHVNNSTYFVYYEQARIEYFQQLESFAKMFTQGSTIIVTGDLYCSYYKPIYFGQTIAVHVQVAEVGRSSLDMQYAITDEEQKQLFASGRGAIIHIDQQSGNSVPWTEEMREAIRSIEPTVNMR